VRPTGTVVTSNASATVGADGGVGVDDARTVIAALPILPSAFAEMTAEPGATALTTPSPETVAMIGLLVLHVTELFNNTLPAESFTVERASEMLPTCSVPESTATAIVAAFGGVGDRTVRLALPDLPRTEAVMIETPGDINEMVPLDAIVATSGFELAQVGVAPCMSIEFLF
jgi:hypothetical protein